MNTEPTRTSVPTMTVARYLAVQIASSDLTQKEIADALGYEHPNVVSMIKTGATKLPFNKIGPLAAVLRIDPRYLLRLALSEYQPDTWAALEPLFDQDFAVSVNERRLLAVLRESFGGNDIDMANTSVARRARSLLAEIEALQRAREDAALDRYNAAAPNAKLGARAATNVGHDIAK